MYISWSRLIVKNRFSAQTKAISRGAVWTVVSDTYVHNLASQKAVWAVFDRFFKKMAVFYLIFKDIINLWIFFGPHLAKIYFVD